MHQQTVHVNDVVWLPCTGPRRTFADLKLIVMWVRERRFFTDHATERILMGDGTPLACVTDDKLSDLDSTLSGLDRCYVEEAFAVSERALGRDDLIMCAYLLGGLVRKPSLPRACPRGKELWFSEPKQSAKNAFCTADTADAPMCSSAEVISHSEINSEQKVGAHHVPLEQVRLVLLLAH